MITTPPIVPIRGTVPTCTVVLGNHRTFATAACASVQALADAASRARELELFMAMAPEGTRSKTGQLGPFKKVTRATTGLAHYCTVSW